jgi:hypothetical protein
MQRATIDRILRDFLCVVVGAWLSILAAVHLWSWPRESWSMMILPVLCLTGMVCPYYLMTSVDFRKRVPRLLVYGLALPGMLFSICFFLGPLITTSHPIGVEWFGLFMALGLFFCLAWYRDCVEKRF